MFVFWVVFCFQVLHITVTASLPWKQGMCSFICSLCCNHTALCYSGKYFCCFFSSAGHTDIAEGCSRPTCLDTHTQRFLGHAGVQRNWGAFYFLRSAQKKHKDHSILKIHQVHLGWGMFLSLIWQLRMENGGGGGNYTQPFFRNPPETKNDFSLSSCCHFPVWIFFMSSVGQRQTWLLVILYLSKIFVSYLMF